jgi:hypothetical protein
MPRNKPAAGNTSAAWIQTASGLAIDLRKVAPTAIHVPDIIEHLSRIVRFLGAAGEWTVAHHSLLVAEIVASEWDAGRPEESQRGRMIGGYLMTTPQQDRFRALLQKIALIHDAHEFATGDIVSPIKQISGPVRIAIKRLESTLDRAIYPAFGLPAWYATHAASFLPIRYVKRADAIALFIERDALMAKGRNGAPEWTTPPIVADFDFASLTASLFRTRATQLSDLAGADLRHRFRSAITGVFGAWETSKSAAAWNYYKPAFSPWRRGNRSRRK